MKIDSAIAIGNTDVRIEVSVDDAKLGTLKISRGTIDWLPRSASKHGYRLSWTEFAELMTNEGRAT